MITDRNTPASIIFKRWVICINTAIFHAGPDFVFRGPPLAVLCVGFPIKDHPITAARFRSAVSQIYSYNIHNVSTFALTTPFGKLFASWRDMVFDTVKNSKATKFLACDIFARHNQSPNQIGCVNWRCQGATWLRLLCSGGLIITLSGCLAGEAMIIVKEQTHTFPNQPLPELRVINYMPNCVRDCIGGSEAAEAKDNKGGVNLTSGMGASTLQETITQSESD